ncbi:hypothetical protein O9993_12510 [Vibrio lentus]|nr:hypothetical protein [Vibrio lentus]
MNVSNILYSSNQNDYFSQYQQLIKGALAPFSVSQTFLGKVRFVDLLFRTAFCRSQAYRALACGVSAFGVSCQIKLQSL